MRLLKGGHTQFTLYSLLAASLLALAGCGGGSSSSSTTSPPPSTVDNTLAVQVNSGPASNYVNGLFTSVTICVPGSTSSCQTIPNVLVDTGSEGLRLLSSQVTLSLPAISDNSNDSLQECVVYGDGSYNWGPVVAADIQLAGEKGSSVPIQLISASPAYPVPSACTSGGGPDENTVASLGANGILGIGNYEQDCGSNCTSASSNVPSMYWLCPNSVCQVTTVPLNYQLQNPVWTFPQDNNGLLISLPSIPADGAPSASGSLIFGIGTQSDNALGSAKVYTLDYSTGDFQTTYNNVAYPSYIDTGSNGISFLDSTTLGIPDCTDYPGWYCPGSTQSYTVTNTGLNGTTAQVLFNVANTDALFVANNGLNWAFDDLAGDSGTSPSTDYVDFGLPFFYGRNVFVGIENQNGPNGVVGPYWAY
jgi:Protein of unknown function (DUF3443)